MCAMVDDVLDERQWSVRPMVICTIDEMRKKMQVLWVVFFVQIYRDGCSDLSLLLLQLFIFCAMFFFPFPSLAATQIFSAGQNSAQLFGSYLEQFTCFLCCSLQEKLLVKFQPDGCSQNSCGTIPRLSCHSHCVVFWEEDFLQLFLQFFL